MPAPQVERRAHLHDRPECPDVVGAGEEAALVGEPLLLDDVDAVQRRAADDHAQQAQLRRPRGEAPAPFADVRVLLGDLLAQVPRQDEHDVRARLAQRLERPDRDVRARQKLALLVRVGVDGVVEEVGAHAAVVQERVALGGGAVARDRLALALEVDQELERRPLVALDTARVVAVGLQRAEPAAASRASSSRARSVSGLQASSS